MTRARHFDPQARLEVTALDERPIRVGVSIFPTLISALEDVEAGRERDRWTVAVRSVLTPHDFEVLLPLVLPARRFIPDCLGPIPDFVPLVPDDELERLV